MNLTLRAHVYIYVWMQNYMIFGIYYYKDIYKSKAARYASGTGICDLIDHSLIEMINKTHVMCLWYTYISFYRNEGGSVEINLTV